MLVFVSFNGGSNWYLGPLLMCALHALLSGRVAHLVTVIVDVVSTEEALRRLHQSKQR
jgi:hypothetical protein